MFPKCDHCGRLFPPAEGQTTAADCLCDRCINRVVGLAPADDDDEPGDEDATPLERDVAVYEVPLTDPLGNEQARVDAGYDIGGEG